MQIRTAGVASAVLQLAAHCSSCTAVISFRWLNTGAHLLKVFLIVGYPPPCIGDMVVEYVGETVRRSVVSLREAAEYDARCGSGTYVFGMSASSGLCTDATRVRLWSDKAS
jgi:hypothetical protein